MMLVGMLTASLSVSAYDFEVDGLYYDIISPTELTCKLANGDAPYTGTLTIPEIVSYRDRELKVIAIGCKLPNVNEVIIGENIISICEKCFENNINLNNIVLPIFLNSIGEYCFSGCTNLVTVEWKGTMILSEGIFNSCFNLSNLKYYKICKKIPKYAFYNCCSLQFDFKETTYLGYASFYGCNGLKQIELNSIEDNSFEVGESAVGVKHIFGDCGKIDYLYIGPNITSIKENHWYGCDIDSLHIADSNIPLLLYCPGAVLGGYYSPEVGQRVRIGNNIKKLYIGRDIKGGIIKNDIMIKSPFESLSIEKAYIGTTVKKMMSYVTIPKPYKTEFCGLFYDNESLKQCIFNGDSIMIWPRTFDGTSIESIKLPHKYNNIGSNCFDSANIKKIEFGEKVILSKNALSSTSPLTLIFHSTEPPEYNSTFTNRQYLDSEIYVPYGAKDKYLSVEPWRNFWNIYEMVDTGVASNCITEREEACRYDLTGNIVTEDYKGIVIIRYTDGKTRKQVIK